MCCSYLVDQLAFHLMMFDFVASKLRRGIFASNTAILITGIKIEAGIVTLCAE